MDGLPALMMADQKITKQKATAPGKVQRWHQSKKGKGIISQFPKRYKTMRRTNSKEVKAAVRNYLLEVAQSEEMESITELKEKFMNEYGWAVARLGQYNACIEWLRGLAINVDYTYYDIIQLMAEWLDETTEEAERWLDKRGDSLYWQLLAREIVNA